MNILTLTQDWFASEWREAGHSVWSCGLADHLDIKVTLPLIHINSIIDQLPGGVTPDVIVAYDNSSPVIFQGLEETDIPTLFYSVDAHHHVNIQTYIAHMFDYVLVAQKDYIPQFEARGSQVEWMPLWASRYIDSSTEKIHKAVFVGNLDAKLNAQRVEFFDALKKVAPVVTMIGKFWEIFPYSEIVLNQTVKGDLNFRVFEAMMSGTLLLTEESGNGLTELFTPDVHLATYQKGNVEQAVERIQFYLSNLKLCREIGGAGREEILKHHTAAHRANRLLEVFKGIKKKRSKIRLFSTMANFASLAFQCEKIDSAVAAKSYVAAMKFLEYAVMEKEQIDSQLACYAVFACSKYDQFIKSREGTRMLEKLCDAYPEETVLKVAKIRNLLNHGEREMAAQLAAAIYNEDVEMTFYRVECFVSLILSGKSFAL